MADFAQMIYGTAQNVAQEQGKGVPEAAIKGTELAQKAENLGIEKTKLVQKQQELQVARFEKFGGFIDTYAKMPKGPARDAFGKHFIPNAVTALDLSDKIDPLVVDMMLKEPALGPYLKSQINRGKMNVSILADAQKVGEVYPEAIKFAAAQGITPKGISEYVASNSSDLLEAEDKALGRKNQVDAAQAAAGVRAEEFETNKKTQLADKVNQAGLPGLKTSLAELDSAIPGGLDGWKPGTDIPGISGASAAIPVSRLSGRAAKVRSASVSVGNQLLKLRNGGAISDGEASRLMAELGIVPTIGEGGSWLDITFKGTTSPENFVNGMKRARNIVGSIEGTYKNAYGEKIYNEVMKTTTPTTAISKDKAQRYLDQYGAKYPNHPEVLAAKKVLGIK